MKTELSGKTQVYGVIGDPIEHSLSPAMHNAAFHALKIDAVFLAFNVKLGKIEDALHGMRSLGIRGLNVTMPHKNAVIPYLDEVDEIAKFLCSVNSIFNDNGKLRGFSTDGTGAHRALEENGTTLSGKKLVLIVGGGAAKAIAYTLAKEVTELVLLNRTPEKTKPLAEAINRTLHKKITTHTLSSNAIRESLQGADIIINATSVGMHPHVAESLIEPEWLKPDMTVMDIVYKPMETKLAKDAKAAGARVISGLEMLIYQGAASFEIWNGQPAPVKVMRQAALNQLQQRVKKVDAGKS
jgi:shikimate dehydrogenase